MISIFGPDDITVCPIEMKDDGTFSGSARDVLFDEGWKSTEFVIQSRALSDISIEGSAQTSAGLVESNFRFDRANAISNQGAKLADLDQTLFEQRTTSVATSLTIDTAGTLSGEGTTGCVMAGSATVPDERFNIYELTVELSNCGALTDTIAEQRNGPYSGLAIFDRHSEQFRAALTTGEIVRVSRAPDVLEQASGDYIFYSQPAANRLADSSTGHK